MGFTITCDACGQQQKLTEEKHYDQPDIAITVNPFTDEHWRSVGIDCENKECKNYI